MTKNGWSVITGAGTGLGRALTVALAREGRPVLLVGRRPEPLEEARQVAAREASEALEVATADVGRAEGRDAVAKALDGGSVEFLIHNAGVLEPIKPASEVELEEWRYAMAVNVEGPLFLSQLLLPTMVPGARILHVSSGAAHKGMPGWAAYCAGKGALYQLYQVLRDEWKAYGVYVGSLRPGVVDTPMQQLIRQQDASDFPAVEQFRTMKEQGELRSPEEVADYTVRLLTKVDGEEFSAEEWDIARKPR